MISADSSKTFDEIKFEYRSHYPYYLQNLTLSTFIDVVMSSVAGLCFFKITKYTESGVCLHRKHITENLLSAV